MSYQIANDGQTLRRRTDLSQDVPASTNFSACGWVLLPAANGEYQTIVALDAASQANFIYLQTPLNSLEIWMVGGTGSAGTSTFTVTGGTWYFWAISAPAVNGVANAYYAVMPGTPGTVASLTGLGAGTTPNAFTVFRLGFGANINEAGESMTGSLYNWKLWSGGTVLTQAQFLTEANNFAPQITANLWAHYHFKSGDTAATDQSGNGRILSPVTSLGTFTANPTGAPAPSALATWEQEGYQWRRDDGTEVTATAIGAQDTPL